MVPLKTLLSHIETKAQLTEHLGKALLMEFADSNKNLVVVYDTSARCNKADIIESDLARHSHEEANTLIPLHVIDAAAHGGGSREIDVVSPDTDVLVLLMDMYSRAGATCQLNFITGRGKAVA